MGDGLSSLRTAVNGLKAGVAGRVNGINTDALDVNACEAYKRALLRIATFADEQLEKVEEELNEHS